MTQQQTDPPPQTPLTDTPEGLRRADGIQLIGEMEGSGYRTPPSLARRGDGQTVQLTPLLYAVLASLDGRRDLAALAEAVHATTGRPVTADNVATLVDKLRELGLAVRQDGADPVLRRSNPLLALRLKVTVTDPERTRRITSPFARLFHPLISVPVVLGFAAICVWVLVVKGLASATHEAFARPGLLLVVLGVTILSGGFHEFGHAAAARRGGADPGVMGAGLYLVWPAFYTDVTDSYRLNRAGRLRTDLGGLYFNAIVVVATMGVWWASGYDAVLLVVATQILQMLRQLLPLVRFDGYHVLADLTGVPDLFQRIGPTLRALVPWRETEPEARALKPWARAVVTVWVLTVVPVLLAVLVLLVLTLPRIVGTALVSADAQRRAMLGGGTSDPTLLESTAHALAMVVVLLPVLAIGYLLVRLVRQIGTATWRRTEGRPVRRGLAVVVALAVVAALALAWWPQEERYRPVQAWEGGTLTDAVALARPPAGYQVGARGNGTIYLPDDAPAPTRERPTLAAVMVPAENPAGADAPTAVSGTDAETGDLEAGDVEQAGGDTWIFPFDEPLAPDPGDNQALAANTTDETAAYSVAFALVWADGAEPLTNTNEAYAAASCDRCAAVAVAFQVVLVVGDANVAVPQNTSVAVNYDCTSCLTFSLAVQLFVTLDGPLSEESTARIEEIWAAATDFGRTIGSVPLDQIQARLTDFEQQILAVVEAEQGPLTPDGESTSPSPGTSGSPSSSPSDGASDGTSDGTSEGSAPSGSAGPTTGPSTGGSTSPSGTASSSPSTSPSGSTSSSPSGSPSSSPSTTASATPSAAGSSGTAGAGTASATP